MKRSKDGRRRETEGNEVDGQLGGKSAAGRGRTGCRSRENKIVVRSCASSRRLLKREGASGIPKIKIKTKRDTPRLKLHNGGR